MVHAKAGSHGPCQPPRKKTVVAKANTTIRMRRPALNIKSRFPVYPAKVPPASSEAMGKSNGGKNANAMAAK